MKLFYSLLLIPSLLTAQQDERTRVAKEQQEITLIQPPASAPKSAPSLPQPEQRGSFPGERPVLRPPQPQPRQPYYPQMPPSRPPMSIPWTPATELDCYRAPINIRNACLFYVRDHTVIPRTPDRRRIQQRIRQATPRQREAIRRARQEFRRQVDSILRKK